jgi:integrase
MRILRVGNIQAVTKYMAGSARETQGAAGGFILFLPSSLNLPPFLRLGEPWLIRREINILAPRHIPRFLEAIWGSIYSALFYTAFATGMRLGELLAETWEDIDLDRGFISVTKALSKRGGVIKIEDTKTDYGRRRIEMSSSLIRVLREHRKAEQAKGETLGRPLEETDLVFSYPGNRPLDPSTITHKFTEVIRQAGLPYLTFHGMRHMHASILIAGGVDIKSVSARLGHASTSFTLDTYGHLLPGSRKAADKFDEAVISELVREPGGEEATGVELVSNVSKMLAKNTEKDDITSEIECEPRRTRTSNRLIKS